MIIFHLITSLDKGGAETHLYSLIKKQVENKFKVFVFYLRGDGYWKKYLNKLGVGTLNLNVANNYDLIGLIRSFLLLNSKIKEIQPKIVHAHLSTMEILAAFLKLKLKNKIRLIITVFFLRHPLEENFF